METPVLIDWILILSNQKRECQWIGYDLWNKKFRVSGSGQLFNR